MKRERNRKRICGGSAWQKKYTNGLLAEDKKDRGRCPADLHMDRIPKFHSLALKNDRTVKGQIILSWILLLKKCEVTDVSLHQLQKILPSSQVSGQLKRIWEHEETDLWKLQTFGQGATAPVGRVRMFINATSELCGTLTRPALTRADEANVPLCSVINRLFQLSSASQDFPETSARQWQSNPG